MNVTSTERAVYAGNGMTLISEISVFTDSATDFSKGMESIGNGASLGFALV